MKSRYDRGKLLKTTANEWTAWQRTLMKEAAKEHEIKSKTYHHRKKWFSTGITLLPSSACWVNTIILLPKCMNFLNHFTLCTGRMRITSFAGSVCMQDDKDETQRIWQCYKEDEYNGNYSNNTKTIMMETLMMMMGATMMMSRQVPLTLNEAWGSFSGP